MTESTQTKASTRKNKKNSLNVEECFAENMTFAAVLKSKFIKSFVSIIKALNFINNTELKISKNGIKYVVEESKSFQTVAYFRRDFFSIFKLRDDDSELSFGINLKNFSELLCALLDDDMANLKIVYYQLKDCVLFSCEQNESAEKTNAKGRAVVEDHDDDEDQPVTTEYFLKTMESFEPLNLDEKGTKLNSLIFDSEDFASALMDLHKSTEEIEITINSNKMQLKSIAALQMEQTVIMPNNDELFSRYDCEKPSKFVYKFAYFKVIMKSLSLSTRTSMQTFSDGLLKIQLMVQCDDDKNEAYIEFYMLANYEDDEEQEAES